MVNCCLGTKQIKYIQENKIQKENKNAVNKNKNSCSSPGYKNLNLIQTQDWRNWCSTAHLKKKIENCSQCEQSPKQW
jgi:hypothetical protein